MGISLSPAPALHTPRRTLHPTCYLPTARCTLPHASTVEQHARLNNTAPLPTWPPTERGYWGTVQAIVAVQPPGLLGDVPGLAAAAADQGRIELAAELMQRTADVPAAELAAVLRVLLEPPSSDAAAAGRQARHEAAAAAAAAAQEAAQQAAAGVPQAQQVQQEQQQEEQQQEAPATAGKPGRRRRGRKRGGSDAGAAAAAAAGEGGEDSDSDVEDLTALVPTIFEPGADRSRGGAQAGASGPADPAQAAPEQPGEREAAVAACCRAAVEGLSPADTCLHVVVALPERQAVLLCALQSLSGTQAVQLMRYLVASLRNVTEIVGSAAAGWAPPLHLPPGAALPSLEQLVAWTSGLIDSCLVKLALEPEVRGGQWRWRQFVRDQLYMGCCFLWPSLAAGPSRGVLWMWAAISWLCRCMERQVVGFPVCSRHSGLWLP